MFYGLSPIRRLILIKKILDVQRGKAPKKKCEAAQANADALLSDAGKEVDKE